MSTSDLAVDEFRRRARRRLIGAIVLALAAAVLLPLLLESEPKPLGDDVSIQIPPLDNSKFINPLSPGKGGELKSGATQPAAKSAAPTNPDASPAAPSPPASNPTPPAAAAEAVAPPAPASTPAKGGPSEAGPAAGPAAATATQAAEPKTQAAAPKTADTTDTQPAAQAGTFVVQVAAFTDRYGALALVRKLKAAGFAAFVEAATTSKGDLHRVRVGPYPSREAADAARAKLKAAGYDGIVARAR
ncbi:MAG TPA: SPOR domain-containing protein [Casimicrobiaceae bacterium]